MKKSTVAALPVLMAVFPFPAFALDTLEPFGIGLSNVEIYGSAVNKGATTVWSTVGYGLGDSLNPFITGGANLQGGKASGIFSFSNNTTFKFGDFDLDIIPHVGYSAVWSGGAGVELTYGFVWAKVVPFLQADTSFAFSGGTYAHSAGGGAFWKIFNGGEFYAKGWYNFTGSNNFALAGGFNYKPVDFMEIIAEGGKSGEVYGTLGAIFTFDPALF